MARLPAIAVGVRRPQLEVNSSGPARMLHGDFSLPGSRFGQLEDGGMKELVRRGLVRGGSMDGLASMVEGRQLDGHVGVGDRYSRGGILDQHAEIHGAGGRESGR